MGPSCISRVGWAVSMKSQSMGRVSPVVSVLIHDVLIQTLVFLLNLLTEKGILQFIRLDTQVDIAVALGQLQRRTQQIFLFLAHV